MSKTFLIFNFHFLSMYKKGHFPENIGSTQGSFLQIIKLCPDGRANYNSDFSPSSASHLGAFV
jgi:hypothetical protein